LADSSLGKLGPPVGGIVNACWIVTGNMLYRMLAVRLTDWENHRTDSEWDRYLVVKTFLFRFTNSYASFFYIAFLKRIWEGHCQTPETVAAQNLPPHLACPGCGTRFNPTPCLLELQIQVLTVFGVQVVAGNIAETATPYAKYKQRMLLDWWSHKQAKKRHAAGDTDREVEKHIEYEQPEFEAKLEPYLEWKYSFDDYSEIVLQYGYVVLFVAAMPLTPILALFNNIIEFHVDAYKLVCVFRRPWPYAAMDIGQWGIFMDMLSALAICTNLGIVIVLGCVPRALETEHLSTFLRLRRHRACIAAAQVGYRAEHQRHPALGRPATPSAQPHYRQAERCRARPRRSPCGGGGAGRRAHPREQLLLRDHEQA